jgi:putative SOS response-associated peptidase YedK
MCAHYESVHDKALLKKHFGVMLPSELARRDVWPGYLSTFIRRQENASNPANSRETSALGREALLGSFGLIPHWAKDEKIARQTYNARTETVAEKPSFRQPWKHAQHCIIPVQSFFEPDWRSGKAVPTCIQLANDEPMGVAGLWATWRSPQGQVVHSFTMLTINADEHTVMRQFHKPQDEKRMIVILPPERYDAWLDASCESSTDFLKTWPADSMVVIQPDQRVHSLGSLWD